MKGLGFDMITDGRYLLPIFVVALWFPFFGGCSGGKHDTKLPMGAATIEELIERYTRAHKNKDMADLRGILQWESQLSSHRYPLEKPMKELFEMPLGEVRFVPGPKLPYERGGEASYLFPRPGKQPRQDVMSGPVYGKLLLVERTVEGREPRVFDPAYIVTQFHDFDGRYYIDILQLVAEDAARAYKTNTPPKHIPQPMEAHENPLNKK